MQTVCFGWGLLVPANTILGQSLEEELVLAISALSLVPLPFMEDFCCQADCLFWVSFTGTGKQYTGIVSQRGTGSSHQHTEFGVTALHGGLLLSCRLFIWGGFCQYQPMAYWGSLQGGNNSSHWQTEFGATALHGGFLLSSGLSYWSLTIDDRIVLLAHQCNCGPNNMNSMQGR